MLTSTQIPGLTSELTTDPMKLGYANYLTSDIAQAGLLNARTGAGSGTVTHIALSRGDWDALLIPMDDLVVSGLNTSGTALAAGVQAKWLARIAAFRAGDPMVSVSIMTPLLNSAVTDGILTTASITAITTRLGSRAEILWGVGTSVTPKDIAIARGNWLKG